MQLNANKRKMKTRTNYTMKSQEKVLNKLKEIDSPVSLTKLSEEAGVSIYVVKESINFLSKLGIVTKITSTGKTTFVTFNKLGNKNATN
jgi:predicted transcriptional regulator